MNTPEAIFEAVAPDRISYKRGGQYVILDGLNAWLYRAMIWQYGKEEATERFWWLWHKKGGAATHNNTALLIRAN